MVFSGRKTGLCFRFFQRPVNEASLLTLSPAAGSTPPPRSSASTTCYVSLSASLSILLPFFSTICLCDFLLARHPLLLSNHLPGILWAAIKLLHKAQPRLDIKHRAVCKEGSVNKLHVRALRGSRTQKKDMGRKGEGEREHESIRYQLQHCYRSHCPLHHYRGSAHIHGGG